MPSSTPPVNLDAKAHQAAPGVALRLSRYEVVALVDVLAGASEGETRAMAKHELAALAEFLQDVKRRRGWT